MRDGQCLVDKGGVFLFVPSNLCSADMNSAQQAHVYITIIKTEIDTVKFKFGV